MNQTIKKIESILTSAYNTVGFTDFIREIFPSVRIIAPDSFRKEYTNFSSHIEGSAHVGNYTDPDGKNMIIHSVRLKKESYVENSRSTQRSYAKKLIEAGNADAAIIAFYTEGDSKWRISFVRLDYEIKFENGKLNTKENLTPAKRYSYLVGKDEPCHTAISRFRRFIIDDSEGTLPTLDDLEEVFSVEKVTEEFFNLYCEKFHQLREALESNPDFIIEAKQHNFTSAQFAKKLMGQIVFLYFLQKKGWLGVAAWPKELSEREYNNAFFARGTKSRELIPKVYIKVAEDKYRLSGRVLNTMSDDDERVLASCVRGRPWGTGSRTFMRTLFEFSQKKNANFFDDYLEPLFYNALNVNRGEQGYDPTLHCRIPFLSGGLFEPIDGYDWEHNNFDIPNEVFSNKKTENDREADGILDIFDRYNFTMSEDEPLEREVAIDPEMLGKVFENLLEVNDRKSKGAFYTPREIVHYMCQETLIVYLVKETGLKEQDIRDFILLGDFLKDEDTTIDRRQGNHDMLISEEIYKIDKDGNVVINRLKDIDKALENIRIADPAVGSGAFPLGMLNEIVRARQNISAYMAITMNAYEIRMMYNNERSPYNLKLQTIKNCIFAADIEPSAVDIAQLRLWLSLVIDDEINPDAQSPLEGHRNPIPLPNLECNIICGNSLIDRFEGIKLINYSDIIGTAVDNQQNNLFQNAFEAVLPSLIEAQNELFRCTDTNKKQEWRDTIEALKDELIRTQMQGASMEQWIRYQKTKKQSSRPFVLWQIDFARVFREKGGFDVVIGNPPYIQLQRTINDETGEKLGDIYEKLGYESFTKTGDIYCLFYEKGYHLLHKNGILSFITSNKWMRSGYGEKLRDFFAKRTNPICLIDFAGQKIFESATVDVNILLFSKSENKGHTLACVIRDKCIDNLSVHIDQNSSVNDFTTNESWIILSPLEHSIRSKIISKGTPLSKWNLAINYGIKTGFNDAFIINAEKKDKLIATDPKSAELIRPILRGRDIKRYSYTFADLWLISTFPSRHYNIDEYPAIKNYLLSFGIERLEQTGKKNIVDGVEVKARKKTNNKWFETQDSISYWNEFSKQKIVWGEISDRPKFAIDIEGQFTPEATTFMMTGKYLKYILCFLNSTLSEYYFSKIGTTTGMGTLRWKKYLIETLPVPKVDDITITSLEQTVDAMLLDYDNLEFYIKSINEKIYNIFDFNHAEIEFIEHMVRIGAH